MNYKNKCFFAKLKQNHLFEYCAMVLIFICFIALLSSIHCVNHSSCLTISKQINNIETTTDEFGVQTLFAAPANNPSGTIDSYTWAEIKEIAKLNLSANEYKTRYGIKVGQIKDNKYILVDLDGNTYDGFVFMYDTDMHDQMNATKTNNGGYKSSFLANEVEKLYTNLIDSDLKNVIKQVSVKCNDVYNNKNTTHTYTCHMFIASAKEVGFNIDQLNKPDAYKNEGSKFDYFVEGRDLSAVNKRMAICSYSAWWVRSANSNYNDTFCFVYENGSYDTYDSYDSCAVIACFVVG